MQWSKCSTNREPKKSEKQKEEKYKASEKYSTY